MVRMFDFRTQLVASLCCGFLSPSMMASMASTTQAADHPSLDAVLFESLWLSIDAAHGPHESLNHDMFFQASNLVQYIMHLSLKPGSDFTQRSRDSVFAQQRRKIQIDTLSSLLNHGTETKIHPTSSLPENTFRLSPYLSRMEVTSCRYHSAK